MRNRCSCSPKYRDKGVTICKEWNDYTIFRRWALANGYEIGLTIERKNNSLGYSPDNCTFIPYGHQAFNRSIVRKAPDGSPLLHLAAKNGITRAAYACRICRGWSPDDAATVPMKMRNPKGGRPRTTPEKIRQIRKMRNEGFKLREIEESLGVSEMTIVRIMNGSRWSHIV